MLFMRGKNEQTNEWGSIFYRKEQKNELAVLVFFPFVKLANVNMISDPIECFVLFVCVRVCYGICVIGVWLWHLSNGDWVSEKLRDLEIKTNHICHAYDK